LEVASEPGFLLGALPLKSQIAKPAAAQSTAANASSPPGSVPAASRDPVDVKVQEAMRERDAIIRNLLERVQELENRLNGVTAAAANVSTPVKPADSSAVPSKRMTEVVTNSAYDEDERRAPEALDQALLVRGGLLLPNGTMEVDNTASYFSTSTTLSR